MNNHYTYFLILGASLAGPLALSFDRKVAFYKKWKYLFPAMFLPALLYIVWDIYFTGRSVWSFNEQYITGINIVNLPLEEVLFFFVVPYCCLFIYECVKTYFPRLRNKRTADVILILGGLALWLTGIIFYQRVYTSWTFILNAAAIAVIYTCRNYFKTFDAALFLVSYCVMLVPFLIVNGFLTAIPVVLYQNTENLGIRILSIPFEDIFYGMLLVLLNVLVYEKLRTKRLDHTD